MVKSVRNRYKKMVNEFNSKIESNRTILAQAQAREKSIRDKFATDDMKLRIIGGEGFYP